MDNMDKRTVNADDGAELAVWCSDDESKPPIVLVHGMPMNHDMWKFQIETSRIATMWLPPIYAAAEHRPDFQAGRIISTNDGQRISTP